jgi:hypothetical protein
MPFGALEETFQDFARKGSDEAYRLQIKITKACGLLIKLDISTR